MVSLLLGDGQTLVTSVRLMHIFLVVPERDSTATAVVMSLMASAPFNGTEDENLAVAYLSVFVLVYIVRPILA